MTTIVCIWSESGLTARRKERDTVLPERVVSYFEVATSVPKLDLYGEHLTLGSHKFAFRDIATHTHVERKPGVYWAVTLERDPCLVGLRKARLVFIALVRDP